MPRAKTSKPKRRLGHFLIQPSKGTQLPPTDYYWSFIAPNGEITADGSEGYRGKSRSGAIRAARAHLRHMGAEGKGIKILVLLPDGTTKEYT